MLGRPIKFSKKEFGIGMLTLCLALAGILPNDRVVFWPCLAAAVACIAWLARVHEGSALTRSLVAVMVSAVLLFVGYRKSTSHPSSVTLQVPSIYTSNDIVSPVKGDGLFKVPVENVGPDLDHVSCDADYFVATRGETGLVVYRWMRFNDNGHLTMKAHAVALIDAHFDVNLEFMRAIEKGIMRRNKTPISGVQITCKCTRTADGLRFTFKPIVYMVTSDLKMLMPPQKRYSKDEIGMLTLEDGNQLADDSRWVDLPFKAGSKDLTVIMK